MRSSFSFFIVVVLVSSLLGGCRTCPPSSTIQKDSIRVVEKTTIKIDTLWKTTDLDSMNLMAYISCDSNNQAQMVLIDSLNRKLSVKAFIKNGTLYIKAKKLSEKYYYLYIYHKTLNEYYQKSVKKEVVVNEVKRPINGFLLTWFIVTAIGLIGFLILVILSKR